jgi:hypothetical protein
MPVRNRINRHVRVRAGDLVPHELNPHMHSEAQRAALRALYDEIGFARSLLAYELPPDEHGAVRLKLIDGHLRRDLDPELVVDVEVLDVSDAEARALLLAIDPLARLADYDARTLADLRSAAEADSPAVRSLWQTLEQNNAQVRAALDRARSAPAPAPPEQFLILVTCKDEEEQLNLLERFQQEGLACKPLFS